MGRQRRHVAPRSQGNRTGLKLSAPTVSTRSCPAVSLASPTIQQTMTHSQRLGTQRRPEPGARSSPKQLHLITSTPETGPTFIRPGKRGTASRGGGVGVGFWMLRRKTFGFALPGECTRNDPHYGGGGPDGVPMAMSRRWADDSWFSLFS